MRERDKGTETKHCRQPRTYPILRVRPNKNLLKFSLSSIQSRRSDRKTKDIRVIALYSAVMKQSEQCGKKWPHARRQVYGKPNPIFQPSVSKNRHYPFSAIGPLSRIHDQATGQVESIMSDGIESASYSVATLRKPPFWTQFPFRKVAMFSNLGSRKNNSGDKMRTPSRTATPYPSTPTARRKILVSIYW